MRSPVGIFVYNRADNTKKTIEALMLNRHAAETDVYVFSDGGKDDASWEKVNEVRQLLKQFKAKAEAEKVLKSLTVIERPENIYLERNIIEGIGYVLERHSTVIVLEDDIATSPYFLDYMNQALYIYKDEERVMHVSGFTNLDLTENEDAPEIYFTPHMSGWGWGTWKHKWEKHFRHYQSREEALDGMTEEDINAIQYDGVFPCLKSLDKNPIPWDICWELAIYKAGGLCITPYHTFVRNIGLKSGTHFCTISWLQHYEYDRDPLNEPLVLTYQQPEKDPRIEALFKTAIHDWGIRYTWLGKAVRYIYKRWKKVF